MAANFTKAEFGQATGVVILDVAEIVAGNRVARVRSNGTVYLLHATDLPVGASSVADWQPPLGEDALYVILATASTPPELAIDRIEVRVPGGQAYLRRLNDPLLVSKVRVKDTGSEGEEARSTVFEISGRRAPLVVFNSRSARRGTITLVTVSRDERDLIEHIVSDGSPLLFNMCSSKAFQPLQAMVGDVRWTRVAMLSARFECDLDYIEVEDGEWVGADEDYLPPVFQSLRYSEIDELTYQQVSDIYGRYTNLATGTPS